jgi:DNA modification methylase
VGHVTSNADHREFAFAHGEMSREEFARFNRQWMEAVLVRLVDGGLFATFIDWLSIDLVIATGRELGLDLINVVVWVKTNGGQGFAMALPARVVAGVQKGRRAAH